MAQSAALNPASMPFFPGGLRSVDDEGVSGLGLGFHPPLREQDRRSLSVSSSEYRSAASSPSPLVDNAVDSKSKPSPEPYEQSRRSPTYRTIDASKVHPGIENIVTRESSIVGSLDTLPESDDSLETPEPTSGGVENQGLRASFFPFRQGREHIPTPPITVYHNGTSLHGHHTSSSPVSSLGSGSQFIPTGDSALSFETQLKASPIIHDILNRLVQCEYVTRELQRNIGDVQNKVNMLVERSLGVSSQPDFKDPFASANSNGHNFTSPQLSGPRLNPRPSLGNIAPNQAAPSDDISSISQRLNTLTSSVGQLLAIQTQQMQSTNTDLRSNSIVAMNPQHGDIAPNQTIPSPNPVALGHGIPLRPEVRSMSRHSNPPMRTWSAGNLDIPMRALDPNVGRQDSIMRDKRRSVTGLLRRDSSGVRYSTTLFYTFKTMPSLVRPWILKVIILLVACHEILVQ